MDKKDGKNPEKSNVIYWDELDLSQYPSQKKRDQKNKNNASAQTPQDVIAKQQQRWKDLSAFVRIVNRFNPPCRLVPPDSQEEYIRSCTTEKLLQILESASLSGSNISFLKGVVTVLGTRIRRLLKH